MVGLEKTSANREETCQVHSIKTAQDTKMAQMRFSMLNEIKFVLGGIWDKLIQNMWFQKISADVKNQMKPDLRPPLLQMGA